MVKNSLNEFINGIRPNARPEHPNFSVSNLAYEIQKTLEELQDKGEHLDNLLAQASPEMFDGIGVEIQRFGADIMGKASSFLQQFQGDNYINESQLRNIIKESINKVLNESFDNIEVGTCPKEADPEGLLDGVTDIEFEERCGTNLFIVFDKSQPPVGCTLSSILLVKRREDVSEDEIRQYEQDRRRYWAVFGSRILDTLLLYVS